MESALRESDELTPQSSDKKRKESYSEFADYNTPQVINPPRCGNHLSSSGSSSATTDDEFIMIEKIIPPKNKVCLCLKCNVY